ncbi:MAG: hypothetical protein Q7T55_05940 [Solirubrobacteraceae bacterium]|nr:hypothetical protein [Solirubrobacteraceae bacterium]
MLLPAEGDRSLLLDAGTWTSTAQVTATGCGSDACTTAHGNWAPSDSTRGVLRSAVLGTTGHAGQAVVTWRSGLFVGPPNAGRAAWTLSLADRRATVAPSTNAASIYTVRILDQASGTGRTVVDRAVVPSSDGPLVPSPPVALPSGALAPGSAYRLEISIRIPFGSSAGDGVVDVAAPQLAVEPASAATTPSPALIDPEVFGPPAPGPSPPPAVDDADAGRGPGEATVVRSALQACLDADHDLSVVGASAASRRLTVEGHADAAPGTAVELLAPDGWKLGRTLVGDDGLFAVTLTEPRGSAGTRQVFARLADGRRSQTSRVERRNVITGDRWSASRVEVRGALVASSIRRGRLSATLDLSGTTPCAMTRHVRARRFDIDRRTGVYRAVFSVPKIATPAGQQPPGPPLARLNIERAGAGAGPRTVTSQVIFGPSSDRRGT